MLERCRLGARARRCGCGTVGCTGGGGLGSLSEILASLVVGSCDRCRPTQREPRALRMIRVSPSWLLARYIAAQSVYVRVAEAHPNRSLLGTV